MKKIYLLFLLAIVFSFNQINAQDPCPDSAFVTAGGTQIFLFFDTDPGIPCGSRPTGISVDGPNVFGINLGNCDTNFTQYVLSFGDPVSESTNFTIVYGTGGNTCTYTDNLLPIDKIALVNRATLKVYPSLVSLSSSSDLNIKFAINMSAKINVFDITGKSMIKDSMDNSNSKQVNVSSLTTGLYILQIVTDFTSITRKFVVMQ